MVLEHFSEVLAVKDGRHHFGVFASSGLCNILHSLKVGHPSPHCPIRNLDQSCSVGVGGLSCSIGVSTVLNITLYKDGDVGWYDKEFYNENSLHLHVVNVHTDAHPHTFEKCDKEFHSEDSLHGHVAGVHTAAHPHPCEKCDK